MNMRVVTAIATTVLLSTVPVGAQQGRAAHPDLQGTWSGSTLTPLQRPPEFKDKAEFTPDEASEYVRSTPDRLRSRLPTDADRLTQSDFGADYVETEVIKLDGYRTSLIVDPPNGMLPPQLPGVQVRISQRPPRNFEGPENFNLAERCLVAMFGLGGSLASPPLLPSQVAAAYFHIVQTDAYVMISSEWIHDARIIRMNGTHLPSHIKSWLGDSIGRWEGSTLVVDTTNFRSETHQLDSGERLHVVERFTRTDANTMMYRVTVDDPDTWATPWTAEWPFKTTDSRIYELACHEGNYAIENGLRGWRAEEQRQAAGK